MPTYPPAPCPRCHQLAWKQSSCSICGYTRRRVYGSRHRTIGKALRASHPRGPCWRCQRPGTWDDPHDPLESGHLDPDGPNELWNYAPEHRSCNRGGARGG